MLVPVFFICAAFSFSSPRSCVMAAFADFISALNSSVFAENLISTSFFALANHLTSSLIDSQTALSHSSYACLFATTDARNGRLAFQNTCSLMPRIRT